MPKVVDHEKYRKQLLARCFDVFAERGYGTLTMRELASALKVSTGTLYHYWQSKQEIFDQLVIFLAEQDRAEFLQAAGNPRTLEEKIAMLVKFLALSEDYMRKQFFITIDYVRQQGLGAMQDNPVVRQSNDIYRDALTEYLQIQDQEVISMVLGFLSGVVMGRLFEGEAVSFERQGHLFTKMLTGYLRQAEGQGC